jgi:hypothetical protein
MISRRILLVCWPFFFSGSVAHARQKKIYSVTGEITAAGFKGFEQFLFNSLDAVIGLKIAFAANEDANAGDLSASQKNGQFVAYLSGPGGESEIVATEGFQYLHGDYVFDGFFVVKSGGMHQGIISLYLARTDEAQVRLSSARIVELDAKRLDSKFKKKN